MITNNFFIVAAIVIYLLVMLAIGVVFSKNNSNTEDFYLGGRKLGPFVTAMSAEASDMSSWLLMGLPGVAYLSGVCDAAWTAIGLGIGTYLNWLFVARRPPFGNCATIPSEHTHEQHGYETSSHHRARLQNGR